MTEKSISPFRQVIKVSLPVAFGYVPLGMAFGMLLSNLGFDWWWATAMGLFIFAGSAQFMAVTLLNAHAGLFAVFIATFFLNLRHVFYGLALRSRYESLGFAKIYAYFGMTDETFSIISSSPKQGSSENQFILTLTAINHFWWVLGCTLGALFRSSVKFDATGLEFSLTALFVVLLLEQWFKNRDVFPIFVGLITGAVTLFVGAREHFLLTSMGLALVICVFRKRKKCTQ